MLAVALLSGAGASVCSASLPGASELASGVAWGSFDLPQADKENAIAKTSSKIFLKKIFSNKISPFTWPGLQELPWLKVSRKGACGHATFEGLAQSQASLPRSIAFLAGYFNPLRGG
jgi:hypothetical protein